MHQIKIVLNYVQNNCQNDTYGIALWGDVADMASPCLCRQPKAKGKKT